MRVRTALPLLALAGCGLQATADSDAVCVTQPLASAPLPGVPAGVPGLSSLSIPFRTSLDVGAAVPSQLDRNGVTTELVAQSISIVTAEGADLSGITSFALTLVRPTNPDDKVVFRYARPAGATGVTTEVRATPDRAVNLVDYLRDGRTLEVQSPEASGRAPSTPWTPALRTCATAKVTVDEVKAAGL